MLKDLIKLANDLDVKGLTVEADMVDRVIRKFSEADFPNHTGQYGTVPYTVVAGDTVYDIAKRHGIDPDPKNGSYSKRYMDLVNMNFDGETFADRHLEANIIEPGQVIFIPGVNLDEAEGEGAYTPFDPDFQSDAERDRERARDRF